MKKTVILVIALVALVGVGRVALSHCEIPCGIYDDQAEIVAMLLDMTTVEKSMKKINELSAMEKPNQNQLVRWVMNKEAHADKIQENVAQYWLTQRIKVPTAGDEKAAAKYHRQLALLHQIIVKAMKMKQTTDLAHVADARMLVKDFSATYFSEEDLKHLHEH
jgi:hypothetical protein